MPAAERSSDDLAALAEAQAGVVARRQLRALGISRRVVRRHLRQRAWQRPLPGTFVVFTGPLPPATRIWAALAYAGPEAVASHSTAAWLQKLADDLPTRLDVTVPHGHRHRGSRSTVRVRQSRHINARRHPAASPPQTRVEDTALDLADDTRDSSEVVDVVLRACQRRLTTAYRLRDRARQRRRMRWRRLVGDVLAEVSDGVQSSLERRYRADVELAHGLPRGSRNRTEGSVGRRRYRDVRYKRWRVLVELDGLAAHPDEWRERDDLRDNEVTVEESATTVRYGWRSVAATPCDTAGQVARLLTRNGWPGSVTACGPTCPAGR